MADLTIFAIGGTGMRCMESLVHICATGMGPKDIDVFLVDPDQKNGNLSKTADLIRAYNSVRIHLSQKEVGKQGYPFHTNIELKQHWNPLTTNDNRNVRTLEDFLSYNALEENEQNLVSLLFSKEERKLDLGHGFRAIPSIGNVVMKSIQYNSAFDDLINQQLAQGGLSKVFIFGSIFGGTGASGYPTIAKVLRSKIKNAIIGGAVIFPYFSFTRPNDDTEEINPEAKRFLENSKAAIPFYKENLDGIFNEHYMIGESESRFLDEFHNGGEEQQNPAHYVELYAALSAIKFNNKEFKDEDPKNIFHAINVSSTKNASGISINLSASVDLPTEGKDFATKIEKLLLTYGYMNSFFEKNDLHQKDPKSLKVKYHLNFVSYLRENFADSQNIADDSLVAFNIYMNDYCRKYLVDVSRINDGNLSFNWINSKELDELFSETIACDFTKIRSDNVQSFITTIGCNTLGELDAYALRSHSEINQSTINKFLNIFHS